MEESGQKLYDNGGIYHGFQIWLNLPGKYKFVDPTTNVYHPDKMGSVETKDYSATVVLGELNGAKSKIETLFPVFYYHIKIKPNGTLTVPTEPLHNAFVYVINGKVEAEGKKSINANQVILYQRGDSEINLFAAEGAELLVCGGVPHNEPVYAYGPFVMNNEEQIRKCFLDYQSGRMGNPELVNGH